MRFPGPLDWRRIIGTFLDDGSESASVGASERGDRERFGRLVEQHKRSVYGLCLRLLRDPEEAKDAAQEAFARAYASRASYDGALPFAPWVLRIARNHCLDLLRRRPETLEPPLQGDPAQPQQPEPADPSAARGDAAVERAELRTSLEAAIAALPVAYREVIHLFHVEQLSYREIAEVMGTPIGTVMTWLHRARAQLRTALRAQGVSP
jgi:RNA polymerase sigma-70 factor (ECF subfamily)